MRDTKIYITVDTREQLPYKFDREQYQGRVEVVLGTLPTGDYSLQGLTDRVAVERKSLADLVQCLGRDRERFERELMRGQALDAFAVVVEASFTELSSGNYRSQLKPHAACQSVMAFMGRYRVPFLFAGSRAAAEYATWSFLRQYIEGYRRNLDAVCRAYSA